MINKFGNKLSLFLPFFFLLFGIQCREERSNLQFETTIDKNKLSGELKTLLELSEKGFLDSVTKIYYDSLKSLYRYTNYNPFWIGAYEKTDSLRKLKDYFGNAYRHGINPERYNYRYIDSVFSNYFSTGRRSEQYNYSALAMLEIKLSLSFLAYQHDIIYGVVDPYRLDPENYSIHRKNKNINVFENLLSENRLATMESIQPVSRRYRQLQEALLRYSDFAETATWENVPHISGKIKRGDKTSVLVPIIQNLKTLQLLPENYTYTDIPEYDSILQESIRIFQSSLGITADGVIGTGTIEQLNISPKQRVQQIQINLERFRWTSYTDSSRYILVNIPDYHLYAVENDSVRCKIKVCVGMKRERDYNRKWERYKKTLKWSHKPKNFETPQVSSFIYAIITNPKWSVPPSIAKDETLAEILKDSTYLKRLGFKVYKDGEVVDYTTVNWKDYTPSNLPYNFVQDPGGANALGKIKFMFHNKYAIYLHDTPTRPPFNTEVRAVSHGCVRVEKPLQLAEFILRNDSQLTADDIRMEIGIKPLDSTRTEEFHKKYRRKPVTKENYLQNPLPVYVDYFTAWVNEKGELQLRADVYEKDKILAEAFYKENHPKSE